jgi:tRNA (cmo5U34)-methyltransferase
MSLVIGKTGDPVHIPKRRDVFEWDKEVASVFDNMAQRSIPMYAETHRVHASLVRKYAESYYRNRNTMDRPLVVADIGASTGAFIKMLCHVYDCDYRSGIPNVDIVAFDSSLDMLDDIGKTLPWVHRIKHDVTLGFQDIDIDFDVVNLSYVLQFLPEAARPNILKSIAKRMRTGGIIFLSHKEKVTVDCLNLMFHQEYVGFRRDNGYSDEEIDAKTKALQNSMWINSFDYTRDMLIDAGLYYVQPTTRWLNFSSMVAFKR